MYLFDTVSNNQNYLKNILHKTSTKKLYLGALGFLEEEEEEEEEEEFQEEEKFSFGAYSYGTI